MDHVEAVKCIGARPVTLGEVGSVVVERMVEVGRRIFQQLIRLVLVDQALMG